MSRLGYAEALHWEGEGEDHREGENVVGGRIMMQETNSKMVHNMRGSVVQ